MARPRGDDWLEDEMRAAREAGVDVLVSALTDREASELGLTNEAGAAAASGIDFRSLAIEDRGVPLNDPATRNTLLQLSSEVERGRHIAIHCRMGIGRSALVAAILLSLTGRSVDESFAALRKVRGVELPDTTEQREWVSAFVANTTQSREGP
jgi:protein-tyrosine phosphatase